MEFITTAVYWFLKALGLLSIPLIVLSAIMTIRTMRKQQRIKPSALVLQALSPLIVLAVYSLLVGLEPPPWLVWLLLVAGVALGVAMSRGVEIEVSEGMLVSRRSSLYVIIWAVTLVLTQTLAVVTNSALASYAFATMYFSVGLALSMNAALLLRATVLKPGTPVTPR